MHFNQLTEYDDTTLSDRQPRKSISMKHICYMFVSIVLRVFSKGVMLHNSDGGPESVTLLWHKMFHVVLKPCDTLDRIYLRSICILFNKVLKIKFLIVGSLTRPSYELWNKIEQSSLSYVMSASRIFQTEWRHSAVYGEACIPVLIPDGHMCCILTCNSNKWSKDTVDQHRHVKLPGHGDVTENIKVHHHRAFVCMLRYCIHGPFTRYAKLPDAHVTRMPGTFPHPCGLAIPTCITARAWRRCRDACRDRKLGNVFEFSGGEKRSQHSRRRHNPQFYVSGKRPIHHSMIQRNTSLI